MFNRYLLLTGKWNNPSPQTMMPEVDSVSEEAVQMVGPSCRHKAGEGTGQIMRRAAASSSKAPSRYLPILLTSIWQFRLAFIWYQPDLVPTIFFFNIFAKGTSICACKRKCTGQCLSGVWLTVVGGSRGAAEDGRFWISWMSRWALQWEKPGWCF